MSESSPLWAELNSLSIHACTPLDSLEVDAGNDDRLRIVSDYRYVPEATNGDAACYSAE